MSEGIAGGTTARLFDVHRMSTHDGPGLRTTLFLKGCALHCPWCHNPESISIHAEPWWFAEKCIRCGSCEAVCPTGAISLTAEGVTIDRGRCERSGECVSVCPSGALQMTGYDQDLAEVLRVASRDKLLFANSGGGVTISGGEPLLQAHFVASIADRLQQQGIHVAIDTCGAVNPEVLDAVLPVVDLILLDLKLLNGDAATRMLGSAATRVRTFAAALARSVRDAARPEVWIRTPIIPGATDAPENIGAIGQFIGSELSGAVARWELCAFNPLGAEKYRRLGVPWEYDEADLIRADILEQLRAVGEEASGRAVPVLATGLTRTTEE